jgi:hypothetical protein
LTDIPGQIGARKLDRTTAGNIKIDAHLNAMINDRQNAIRKITIRYQNIICARFDLA